jgi:TPR repeat protein
MKALVKKADGGCAKSAVDLFHMISDFDEGRVWLQKAAELGDAWAQFKEGYYIQSLATDDKGLSFLEREKEYQDAIVLLRKSADQGQAEAYNILAHAYYKGYGVERDLVKSHEYDLEGSKRGYYVSSYSAAQNYRIGSASYLKTWGEMSSRPSVSIACRSNRAAHKPGTL